MTNDNLFWLAVYRAIMAIAAAIKRYKLQGENDGVLIQKVDAKPQT